MRYPRFVDPDDVLSLEFEIVSQELRVHLTRELDSRITPEAYPENKIVHQNSIINMSRSLAGLPQYVLESDDDGSFLPAEHAWHTGEFHLSLRQLDTVQLVELLGELINDEWFRVDEINELLKRDGVSFKYVLHNDRLRVEVYPLNRLETEAEETGHPNIRVLVKRMDDSLDRDDFSGVLHASASIFETMAKDIVASPSVQDQTLGSFFDRYRKDSSLPIEVLDYVKSVYDARSTTPLAGHGHTQPSSITIEEAVVLAEMTKAFVKIEYTLRAASSSGNANQTA